MNKNTNDTLKLKIKDLKKTGIIILLVVIIIVLIGLMVFYFVKKSKHEDIATEVSQVVEDIIIGEEGKVYTLSKSQLEQVVTTSKLYTAEYPYNGVVTVTDPDDATKIRYYVAYEGVVKAGIDVTKIEVDLDEENEMIKIYLPEVTLEDPVVDAGKLAYIFENEAYNTPNVAQEAYKLAIEDLKDKAARDDQLKQLATQTAKTAEQALVEPWVNQVDEKHHYTVKVVAYGEEE